MSDSNKQKNVDIGEIAQALLNRIEGSRIEAQVRAEGMKEGVRLLFEELRIAMMPAEEKSAERSEAGNGQE